MENIKRKISALMIMVMLMSAFSFVLADNANAGTSPVSSGTLYYTRDHITFKNIKVKASYKIYRQTKKKGKKKTYKYYSVITRESTTKTEKKILGLYIGIKPDKASPYTTTKYSSFTKAKDAACNYAYKATYPFKARAYKANPKLSNDENKKKYKKKKWTRCWTKRP